MTSGEGAATALAAVRAIKAQRDNESAPAQARHHRPPRYELVA
jgi:hypothetical protein